MGYSSAKKGVAVVTAVIVAVVMVCVSVVCNLFSTKTESSNQTYLDDAKAQLTEYSDNYNYTKFEFMNSLFEKANVIASVVSSSRKFVPTFLSSDDAIILPSASVITNELMPRFFTSEAFVSAVEGEDGVYNLMACVARTEGGIVIIDTNTSDYSAVIGANIAKSCKGDTIIVKNGEVVSTNMNLGDNGLKSAGITDEMIRSENFNVTIDGTRNYDTVNHIETAFCCSLSADNCIFT